MPRSGVFTGIIEARCPVLAAADAAGGRRVRLDLAPLRAAPRSLALPGGPPGIAGTPLAHLGDSLAVSGCCLTVASLSGDHAEFDVVAETLQRTNLGALSAGSAVNVERSLRLGDPVDGHLVSGHVERTGRVAALDERPGEHRLVIECGADFAARTLPKGSVAVEGVSLTVAELQRDRFAVALVPHTLERTTLRDLRPGDVVNLEPDLIGQWVLRAVASRESG
jgi:riboflavin synthase